MNSTTVPITNSSNATGNSTFTSPTETLQNTFGPYTTAYGIVFFILCVCRFLCPQAFNVRHTYRDKTNDPSSTTNSNHDTEQDSPDHNLRMPLHHPPDHEPHPRLAAERFGFFSWFWNVHTIPDAAFLEECGMDALSVARITTMGLKMSVMGMLTSSFLIPVYRWAGDKRTDGVLQVSIVNCHPGSSRLMVTVLGAYIIFGYCIYLIRQDFQWFIAMRHRFLRQPRARNFSVYVRNIPEGYRSSWGLQKFFEQCLRNIQVVGSHVRVDSKNLQKQAATREQTRMKLEHAVAVEEETGTRPTHSTFPMGLAGGREVVDSIQHYTQLLEEQNRDVTKRILELQEIANQCTESEDLAADDEDEEQQRLRSRDLFTFMADGTTDAVVNAAVTTLDITGEATGMVTKGAKGAIRLVLPGEDGELNSGGFISFQRITIANAALQMVHHEMPHEMEITEAPDPIDVYWSNVGREHADLQSGKLISGFLTTVICLLWTVPVTFVSGLSSADALGAAFPFIQNLLDQFPNLAVVLNALAPQLLVILNSLLPVILRFISAYEGPVSGAVIETSLFVKLAAVMIIQTFFVSAISGGIIDQLYAWAQQPGEFIDYLANTLPGQSTFFMQLSFVQTFTTLAMEGLRVSPIGIAMARRLIGPHLTKREKELVVLGLRPLSQPPPFAVAHALSNMVLHFMVFFVYACIAPLVGFVTTFCFIVLGGLYRHHFIYIYKPYPDSGGKIWAKFIRIILVCMIIAEITIVGLLALKKATLPTMFMLPLVVMTALFYLYLHRQHFRVANVLPSRLCMRQDVINHRELDFSFLCTAYLQPEMLHKQIFPDLAPERLEELGISVGGHDGTQTQDSGCAEAPDDIYLDDSHYREMETTNGVRCRVKTLPLPSDLFVVTTDEDG